MNAREGFEMSLQGIQTGIWRARMQIFHNILYRSRQGEEKIRLVLGPGRSGTTWLFKVLMNSETRLRAVNEPLNPFRVKIRFAGSYDRTARRYKDKLQEDDVLVKLYSMMAHPKYDLTRLLPKQILRDDPDFKLVLIKEVHSLLLTEALIRHYARPSVLIIRDPIYVVDSQLKYSGFGSPIWMNEHSYLAEKAFLEMYFPSSRSKIREEVRRNLGLRGRRKEIMSKVLAVGCINQMFRQISERDRNSCLVEYESLCSDPEGEFIRAAGHLGLELGKKGLSYLRKTQRKSKEKSGPNSVYRDTQDQIGRKFYILDEDEVAAARRMLGRCGL